MISRTQCHFQRPSFRAYSVSEDGDAPPGALLPPAQPALLTLAADQAVRIWVEVTMAAPRMPEAMDAASSSPPAQRSPPAVSLGPTQSRCCHAISLVCFEQVLEGGPRPSARS